MARIHSGRPAKRSRIRRTVSQVAVEAWCRSSRKRARGAARSPSPPSPPSPASSSRRFRASTSRDSKSPGVESPGVESPGAAPSGSSPEAPGADPPRGTVSPCRMPLSGRPPHQGEISVQRPWMMVARWRDDRRPRRVRASRVLPAPTSPTTRARRQPAPRAARQLASSSRRLSSRPTRGTKGAGGGLPRAGGPRSAAPASAVSPPPIAGRLSWRMLSNRRRVLAAGATPSSLSRSVSSSS